MAATSVSVIALLGGTEYTTALRLLFVADRGIVEEGVRIVNPPAVEVGRAGCHL